MKKQSLIKRLFAFAGNYKYLTILGVILSAVSAVLGLLPIVFIWLGVGEVFEMYPNFSITPTLKNYSYMAVIFSVISILVYFAALMCTHIAAFRIAKNMRYQTMSHLMKLPLGYFNETGSGKLRRIISDSASLTETYLAHQLPDLVGAFVTPIAVLVLIFAFDFRFALISLISLVLATLSQFMMMGKGYAQRVETFQTSLEKINNEAVEYVKGIPVVKTFGQTIFSFKKFHNTIKEVEDCAINYTYFYRKPMVLFQTFLGSTVVFLTLGAIILFMSGSNLESLMLDYIFYILFTPIYTVMMMKIMWTSQYSMIAKDAVDRIENLLNEKPLPQGSDEIKLNNYDISLKDVCFKYPDTQKNALTNINLDIKQGETIALVGASGGGKSTLATLIARFFDASTGSVKIGGINVGELSDETLMKNISFVFQNENLYKASILDNVKEGNPNASKEDVIKALKSARCEDIINKLPQGIDTVVGGDGVFLSGGQAQRIAIARAILKDAPIVILDEATAFTDPENEHQIQLALSQLTKGKTVVMIAHRLSTVKNVDCIYYLEDGRIKEHGTHNELVLLGQKYSTMWNEYQSAFSWKDSEVTV